MSCYLEQAENVVKSVCLQFKISNFEVHWVGWSVKTSSDKDLVWL